MPQKSFGIKNIPNIPKPKKNNANPAIRFILSTKKDIYPYYNICLFYCCFPILYYVAIHRMDVVILILFLYLLYLPTLSEYLSSPAQPLSLLHHPQKYHLLLMPHHLFLK